MFCELICRNGQSETQQVENKIEEIRIPFQFIFKLPSLRKARNIVQRDKLGRIVSSVVPNIIK